MSPKKRLTCLEGINWWGWSNPKAGYGIVNLEYSTALERLTGFVSYGWERKDDLNINDFNLLTDEQKSMLEKPFKKEKIGIIKTIPSMFFHNASEFRIGYTMVENTKIGKKWVEMCNQMDAIFVPSKFLVDVFRSCGVTKPIKVVKQGVDSRKFPFIKRVKKTPFVFGTVGYMDDRKNWQDMVTAFTSEFNNNEPVELWIKNSNQYFNYTLFKDRRIKSINKYYSFEEMHKLYSLMDCFLCPSHAEGSALTPREAMATGLPTILTNWSGMTEIAYHEFSYPLTPIAIDFPDIRGQEQPGFMARLNVRELMYWMRYVYEHQEEAYDKGIMASKFIHRNYNWDVCAKDLLKKVEEVYYE
jgi:glycosyltransferase involved in cell wall biosynthesis